MRSGQIHGKNGKGARSPAATVNPNPIAACCQALERRLLLAHHTINFDDLPASTTTLVHVTDQYPGVVFSSLSGLANATAFVGDQPPPHLYGTSDPRWLGAGLADYDSEDSDFVKEFHTDELYLDFTNPVDHLKFTAIEQIHTSIPETATVRVYTGGATQDVSIEAPNPTNDVGATDNVDLSAFSAVTRIEIFGFRHYGFQYDDFQFDDHTASPPPPSPPTPPPPPPVPPPANGVILGHIEDADGNRVHGVQVTDVTLGRTLFTDYTEGATSTSSFSSGGTEAVVSGNFAFDRVDTTHDSTFNVTAHTLDGVTYPLTFVVHPSQFDSTHTADLGGIKIPALKVVDSDGNILLLRDDLNPANSDIIRRRDISGGGNESLIARSARYKAEVTAVTQKLASLGFRQSDGTGNGEDAPPLTVTDTWASTLTRFGEPPKQAALSTPPQERALLLFQAIWLHGSDTGFVFNDAILNHNRSVINGQVDAATLSALNAASGVIWATDEAAAKATFPNFFTYQTSNTNRWMNGSAIKVLSELSASLKRNRIGPLNLNSASPATGLREAGGGHAAGSEIDITWVTHTGAAGQRDFYQPIQGLKDAQVAKGANGEPLEFVQVMRGTQPVTVRAEWTQQDMANGLDTPAKAIAAGRTWTVVPNYDRALTSTLIKQILAFPSTRVYQVIFNDPELHNPNDTQFYVGADSRFISVSNHNNHVHIGTKFTGDTLGSGTSGAPAWPPAAFPDRSVTPSVTVGAAATLGGTIVDAHRDVFMLDVNWGDGTRTRTYRFPASLARPVTLKHAYRHAGDFNVTVQWHSRRANGNVATLGVHVDPKPARATRPRDRHAIAMVMDSRFRGLFAT